MTREEFINETIGIIKDIEDDHNETTFLIGYLNEQVLTADFEVPLEEILVLIREYKPHIYLHMKFTSSKDFRKLLNSDLTVEEALQRLGKDSF